VDAARGILHWLDAVPARNETLAWLSFAVTLALALRAPLDRPGAAQSRRANLADRWAFALAVLVTLTAFRWPVWFAPNELNPDESQALAGARTLLDYPVFWKYVDGTTHGPLVEFFLVPFGWLGLPLNYVTARFAATLLQGLTLLGAWGALRLIIGERAARLALFPALTFWCCVHWADYTHYSTELVPGALIAASLLAAATGLLGGALNRRAALGWLASAGAALGAVPYAKLQLVPLALLAGAGVLAALFARRAEPGTGRLAAATIAGALTPSAIVAIFLTIFGLWGQFQGAYIQSNLGYVDAKPTGFMDMASDFFALITHGQSYAWFFVPTLGYALWHGRATWTESDASRRALLLGAWLAVAVGFYSVVTPGRMLAHYLQLLVLPLTGVAALHFATTITRGGARAATLATVVFLLITLAPQMARRATGYHIYTGRLTEHLAQPPLPASAVLLTHAQPGDRLAMWGWQAQVFVETNLPMGTREAHTAYQLNPGPLRDFYRQRYLRDMTRRRPEWFVDAVGPHGFGYTNRTVDGHETFPELAAFVRANYRFVTEAGGLRIYQLARGS
jgi:hypothetical protein